MVRSSVFGDKLLFSLTTRVVKRSSYTLKDARTFLLSLITLFTGC